MGGQARAGGRRADREYLARYDASRFERPSVAVDVVLLTTAGSQLQTLLVRRQEPPAKGLWSLPGGFVDVRESLDVAAERVLRLKAGLTDVFLEQLYTFGDPARDPRTRVISVAYYALVPDQRLKTSDGSSPIERALAKIELPATAGSAACPIVKLADGTRIRLAFDHETILATAVRRLRGKLAYVPLGFELLPPTFTLRQLQIVHEAILGRRLNKDAFRRRVLASGLLRPTGRRQEDVDHRPAELYRVSRRKARLGGQGD